MTKSTSSRHLPNRDEFVAFWKGQTSFPRCCGCYAVYLGGLALAAVVSRLADRWGRAAIPVLWGAIAFVILFPILYSLVYWKRYDRFLRCPQCRDWIGADDRGRTCGIGPDPRWVKISQTGCCPKCGAQMLVLEEKEQKTSGAASENL